MKKSIATAILTAGLVAAPLAPAVAVAGDAGHSPGVVTRTEFANVKRGMSQGRVHAIFDTKGKVTSSYSGWGYRSQSREYNAKGEWSFVFVDFEYKNGGWRVTSKSAYWG